MGVTYKKSTWAASPVRHAIRQAFNDLERQGVTARMRWGHCRACNLATISRMLTLSPEVNRPTEWVFYSKIDFYEALKTGLLLISYGSLRRQNAARMHDAALGAKVVAAFQAHGLSPEWDGDPERRIHLRIDLK